MLKRTKTSSKKRHSVFIDIRHTKSVQSTLEEEAGKPEMYQAKNKSVEAQSSNTGAVATRKTQSRSKLKRSSVLLDNTMVRDYNLAIRHFEKLDTRPIQTSSSHGSISSNSSTVSSLFSATSTTSIREMLYDDLEESCEEDCEIIDKTHSWIMKFNDGKGRLRVDDSELTRQACPRTNLQFE